MLIKYLDAALNKLPKYKGEVTRSIYFFNEDQLNKFVKDHTSNNIVKYTGYTSATTGDVYNPAGQVELYILSKTGRDIRKYNESEQEILFKRGVSFIVTDLEEVEGKFYIRLKEV
ncbi:hypothetical protein HH307_03065 [Bacillus coagulans]|nr:hypothetical protein [Heyndrickxia coagulans]